MFVLGMTRDGCDWMFVTGQAPVIKDPEARGGKNKAQPKKQGTMRNREFVGQIC